MVEMGNTVLWNMIGLVLFLAGLISLFRLAQKNRPKMKPLLLLFLAILGFVLFGVSSLEFFREDYLGRSLSIDGLVENQQFELLEWHPIYALVMFRGGNIIDQKLVSGLPRMPNGTKFFIHNGRVCRGDSIPKPVPQVAF